MPFKNKETKDAYYKANKEKVDAKRRALELKRRYGITIEDYNRMFNEQNGCCAICKKHQTHFEKALAVDHDHETEKVRGLLCRACNTAIGLLQDNPDVILEASNYVRGNKL